MTSLGEARRAVVTQLGTLGVPVHATPPAPLSAPCIVVSEGDPWLDMQNFGCHIVRWRVHLIARPGSNAAVIAQLDDLTTRLVSADGDFPTATVQGYQPFTHNGQEYLMAVVDIEEELEIAND